MVNTEVQKDSISYNLIPLDMLGYNEKGKIINILAGQGAIKRLSSLGLTPGTIVTKICEAPLLGPIQISVRNTRIAIGRGLAQKVLVQRMLE